MHTMVVQMSTDPSRTDVVTRHLREDIVNWARQQPGFVSGQWLLGSGQTRGLGVVVFASEDAATAAAQGPRSFPRDEGRAWNVEDVTVYQQVTSALRVTRIRTPPRAASRRSRESHPDGTQSPLPRPYRKAAPWNDHHAARPLRCVVDA